MRSIQLGGQIMPLSIHAINIKMAAAENTIACYFNFKHNVEIGVKAIKYVNILSYIAISQY